MAASQEVSSHGSARADRGAVRAKWKWQIHTGAVAGRHAPVKLVMSISATTRPPRPNEVNGRDYWFLTDAEFRKRLAEGQFMEHAEVFSSGFLYGTL